MPSTSQTAGSGALWAPSPEQIERATITRFARWVQETRGTDVTASYEQLHAWSVSDVARFWGAIWEFFDVQADGSALPVLDDPAMPGAHWFPRARLNYAEHVFRDRDPAAPALHFAAEAEPLQAQTWGELCEQTRRIAHGLRALGVGPGDRVAAYLPNVPETIAAFLACASIGAIWSSAAPEFGARAVAERFAQIEPKVLLAVDGYRYGGREFDRRATIGRLRDEVASIEHVVVLDRIGSDAVPGALRWEELTAVDAELGFTRVAFDHPLWVLYSSGTTGLPKPIVHGHGGMLLEHLKTVGLHLDARAGDRVLWFTTTGWMMWNFLVGVLLTPASIVLYDGNPATPTLDRLWDLADEAGVTCFGTSASFVSTCRKQGVVPRSDDRPLRALRAVGSTGSPLTPEDFDWVGGALGADTWLFSMSGGTDMCTAFVGGVVTLPVHRGELQARALGADVQAFDPEGRPLTGEVGELVICQPMPCMPVGFWGDADGSRYRASYFEHYPGVWRHGDWIEFTARGSAVIHGRSDATINRGGIRMGTSEIYRAVLALDDVIDAVVVDVPGRFGFDQGWMPLFVVLRDGFVLDADLERRIRARIRTDCSPRHVPDEIHPIAEVPRTLSGKVLEIPLKRLLMGEAAERVVSREALANPAAFDAFVRLAAAELSKG